MGSAVQSAPTEIKVWFTEEIEPSFSTLQVLDSAGKVIDKKDTHVDSKDKKLLIVSLASFLPANTKWCGAWSPAIHIGRTAISNSR